VAQLEVVLDTNVLVAAFRSNLGASFQGLQALDVGTWRPVVSPTLVFEYEAVLKRDLTGTGFGLGDIDDFIEYFCMCSRLVEVRVRRRPVLKDPDDDRILEVAVTAGVPIVTFNRRDFVGSARFGVDVLSPAELLRAIRKLGLR